jgi:hypothetical protein
MSFVPNYDDNGFEDDFKDNFDDFDDTIN